MCACVCVCVCVCVWAGGSKVRQRVAELQKGGNLRNGGAELQKWGVAEMGEVWIPLLSIFIIPLSEKNKKLSIISLGSRSNVK